jgi:hypothetical protein
MNRQAVRKPAELELQEGPAPRRSPASGNEFTSLSSAKAYLDQLVERVRSRDWSDAAEAIGEVETAYSRFPELEADCPRRELAHNCRVAAGKANEPVGSVLLIIAATLLPSDPALVALLLERLARSGNGKVLFAVVRLICRQRGLSWDELKGAVAGLRAWNATTDIGEILAETLSLLPPLSAAAEDELGEILASIWAGGAAHDADQAALTRAVCDLRRRLKHVGHPPGNEPYPGDLIALAERVAAAISVPRYDNRPHVAWPSGRLTLSQFLVQWPFERFEVPARRLSTVYGTLTGDGLLTAGRHTGAAFCYGPYLQLPSGTYAIEVSGRIAAAAKYSIRLMHFVAEQPSLLVRQHYSLQHSAAGVLARLEFATAKDLVNFETVMEVTTSEVDVAISGLTISRLADNSSSPPRTTLDATGRR